jgi:hypothetical protein
LKQRNITLKNASPLIAPYKLLGRSTAGALMNLRNFLKINFYKQLNINILTQARKGD